MPTILQEHLLTQSWRRLLAILAAHGLSISTSKAKTPLIAQLHTHLTKPKILVAIIAQLDPTAKDALRALRAADGALPVHTFEERFGPIRPYRPWRKDADAGASQPWLAPISATETLWYLGLIYRDPPKRKPGLTQHYVIPADLLSLLAPHLDQPTLGLPGARHPLPGCNGPLDHHLTIWLATINERAIRPLHKRWLPPTDATSCTKGDHGNDSKCPGKPKLSKPKLQLYPTTPSL